MRISDLSSDVCSSDLTIHNRFDRQHDQAIASAVQPFEGAPLQFDDIARAWFFIDQTDEIGLPPDKALRQNIGMVVELLGRPEHLLAQCGRDMRFVVNDARHAFGRHLSSEERSGGTAWVSRCKTRWAPYH